jgi:hypothetical protein
MKTMQHHLHKPLLALFLVATCLAPGVQAASVGSAGYTNDFSAQPPAADWSTYPIAGGAGNVTTAAQLDAAVQTIAASAVTAQTVADATVPSAANGSATWSSTGFYLQTRPTGINATLLMCTLVNNLGMNAGSVTISYDFAELLPVTEEVVGQRGYYSLSGAAGSWTVIPAFCSATPGRVTATLTMTWPSGSPLYILWADDNGSGSPDTACQIDNVSVKATPAAQVPVSITSSPQDQSVLELSSVSFHVVATGYPAPTYQWYRNDTLIASATNDTCTLLQAHLSDDRTAFYVVASNMVTNVSYVVTSSVATLLVQADTTPPVVVNVHPTTNTLVNNLQYVEVFFSKPVTGVDAFDLLIDGTPATNVSVSTAWQYYFQFPQPPTGTVQVSWNPTHGITDLTAAANPFAGGGWTYRLDTNIVYIGLRINEILAGNKHINRDEDGDYSDWIELYNPGPNVVPLGGCFLTDDEHNLNQWQFPPVSLVANGYLLVWASGKNRTNSPTALHTNFKLNKGGGYLALVEPDGASIISTFTPGYPAQHTDVSYGCDRTEPSLLGFFTTPTPGAPNSSSGAGFGPEVRYSQDSGTFTTPFYLALFTSSTNAAIRYTFGSNAPTSSSTLYTGPILITNTVRLRARTYVNGLMPGDIQSKDYICLDTSANNVPGWGSNLIGFSSSLPVVVFHNYAQGAIPNTDPAQFCMMQVFEPKNGRSSLTNVPDLAVMANFHRRGQATLGDPKPNLRVTILDEHGGGNDVPLLGFPADNDWVFYGPNGYDKVLMHNPFSQQLYRQLGRYSPRTRFVEVFVNKDAYQSGPPGPLQSADYYGIYVVVEKIKIAKDRVDMDELEPENTNAPSVTGGYLFSVDKANPGSTFTAANQAMWYLNPDYATITTPQRAPQLQYLNQYLNNAFTAMTSPGWTNPVTGYAAWIDVPAWIDYVQSQTLVFNADMLRISAYWTKPRNDKWTPACLWDFDRAFGMYAHDTDQRGFNPFLWHSANGDRGTDPFNADGDGGYMNPWYSKLFLDPDFFQKFIDRYQDLRRSVYSFSNVTALINRLGNDVAEPTIREYANVAAKGWTGGVSDTTPNQGTVTGDGWTYNFPSPGTWPAELQFVRVWFTNRLTFMETNFLAVSTLSQPGGQVVSGSFITLRPATEAGSSVLYTLNGTDPRLPGGAISGTALSNNGPVTLTITTNVRVFARSWNANHRNLTGAHNPPLNSTWSGVTAESYYTVTPTLRITELMYHPAPLPGNTNDADNFEYVELTNVGSNTLSLIGFQFTNGITFTFTATNRVTSLAPGGRVLLVKSLAAFALRYPTVTNLVAGEYGGSLDNAGEELALVGPMGEPILDFSYDPNWYPLTDGEGFSLVAVNENAPPSAWTNAAQWRTSAYDGGSPGAADSAPVPVLPVLVNELLSLPVPPACDAVELFNPNGTDADIGGWYLTDNYDAPKKYRIPDGTSIPAYGFTVFYETNSFGAPGLPDAFGFSSKGEDVYLFSGDSLGRLTGYAHGFSFGAAEDMRSFGRYVTSDGQEHFELQTANTLGTTNGLPRVGPVVINELMYHPPDVGGNDNTLDEYIELLNLTAEAVPLFDPAAPANTWQVKGGVDFIFPTNVTLPAGQYLLLVNFDPGDTNLLASFVAKYAVPGGVLILGPYGGKLNNSGDSVELKRPTLQLGVDPAWVLLDKVQYSDGAPWPCGTSGSGVSLQRQQAGAFGNDPLNWAGLNPTAGRANIMVAPGAPVIVIPPTDRVAVAGGSTMFSVGVCGPPPYTYQWLFHGNTIGNATNVTYSINPVHDTDEGPYSVVVGNASGSVTSPPALLYVAKPPVLVQQPQSLLVPLYGLASFSVIATGTPPLQFQWRRNGTFLAGQTNSTLTLTSVQITNAGRYSVVVGNPYGSTISADALLSVDAPLTILEQPQNVTIGPVATNYSTNTVSLNVTAVGHGPVSYQWLFWGTNLPGATSATLTISNVALSNAGPYAVVVSDPLQSQLSSNATLTLLVKPYITVPIVAQSVVYGGTVSFSVWAGPAHPTLPLTYRWLKGGVYIATNDQPTLVVSNVTASTYCQVVVVNAAGTAFKPQVALNVLPDTDRDGLPDAMELAMGYPTNNAADGGWDSDGDGMSNAAEVAAGTDPTSKLSVLKLVFPTTNAVANGQVQFYFTAMSNKTYSVEYRSGFSAGEWTTLVSFDSLLTNRVIWVTDTPSFVRRFYRVKTPRNPPEQLGVLKLDLVSSGDGKIRLHLTAAANRSYSLEFRDSLSQGSWNNLMSFDSSPQTRDLWVTNALPPGAVNRFYRSKTPGDF